MATIDVLAALNVSVVVPTFNRKDITIQFIRRINSQNTPIRIYLSDSGSSDGTVESAVMEPNVVIVPAGAASWWSAAVNKGIELALREGADVIVLMNDDIEFAEDLVSTLLKMHQSYPRNIVSPVQRTESGLFVGTVYDGLFRRVRHLAAVPQDGLVATSNGCCLLIPKEIFISVGRFDEKNCPHLYGDTEFQLRAQRRGFSTRVCGDSAIYQMSQTDYFSRLKIRSLFTFEGSPLLWRAYSTFGRALYGGFWYFAVFGINFHYEFAKVLLKTLKFLTLRHFNMKNESNAQF